MKTILALVDFSDVTPAVVKTAADMARALGAKLFLMHAAQPETYVTTTEIGPVVSREGIAENLRSDHRKLQELAKELTAQGVTTTAILTHGTPVEKSIEHAKKLAAELVVLGSHRHGALYHLLLGNVATGVLKQAPCPVIVVPSPMALK